MAKKETEEIEEPTLEDLEEDDIEEVEAPAEEEEKEEVETESLEARVETEKKSVDDADEAEGSFMSVDAAEKRNVKKSDLKLDEIADDIKDALVYLSYEWANGVMNPDDITIVVIKKAA